MFKLSRVSCVAPEGVNKEPLEARSKPPRSNYRGRRRNYSYGRRKNQVEPALAPKPHDAPMSKSDLYFALDCEMVGVGENGVDSALARVSIVNWENEVVLDTFVKVSVPVTDYRTYVSGVKPQDLESPDAMEFEDCRLAVKNILCGKILIGHGLENDLSALHLTHPRSDVRDTAAYGLLMRKVLIDGKMVLFPRKLRDLAWEKLERQIQVEGKAHSPVEDAITALDLYKSVRPSWEKHLVQEAMEKEREAEHQRLRLESQMYANHVHHMNSMHLDQQRVAHAQMDQRGVPHSRDAPGYHKVYYNRGFPPPPQPVQYVATPHSPEAPQEQNYVQYDGSPPRDVAYPQQVYHYNAPPSQATSFFRFPQGLVPVYLSSRKSRRHQQQRAPEHSEAPEEQVVEAAEQ